MTEKDLARVDTLTFDIFGTVLDLSGNITPRVAEFLEQNNVALDAQEFWKQWRARQRIEQHQDTILMLGHCGYLEAARRALVFTLKVNQIEYGNNDVESLMRVFHKLRPFDDAVAGLRRLSKRYRLAALSNGNQTLLDHLADHHIPVNFHAKISVESVGRFKPHPAVYRTAAMELQREPGQILMVAAHAFDILGARACGFRGAYVNRYRLPYEDSPLRPDITVNDFVELADRLVGAE